jgi:hypothetical protein
MSAGVGKTYRMLQEAHDLLRKNVNVKVGYVESGKIQLNLQPVPVNDIISKALAAVQNTAKE